MNYALQRVSALSLDEEHNPESYDGRFKDLFQETFDAEFKDQLRGERPNL